MKEKVDHLRAFHEFETALASWQKHIYNQKFK